MGRCWSLLGPSWGPLGHFLACFGALWGRLGPPSRPQGSFQLPSSSSTKPPKISTFPKTWGGGVCPLRGIQLNDHDAADFCRSSLFTTALPWPGSESDHRPGSYGRKVTAGPGSPATLKENHVKHPDWAKRVAREYHLHMQEHTMANDVPDGLQKLHYSRRLFTRWNTQCRRPRMAKIT